MTQQNSKPSYKVLISGGGTGGHIFPAVAIANALRRRLGDDGVDILFVGALGRMEMERVPAAGYKIIGLPVAGFDRKRLWRNVGVLLKLMKSMGMARKIIRQFNPDIAIGVGGYASGPMLKAAQRRGVATLIQEQNSYAGVTNKLLGKRANVVCVAYGGMERFFPEASKIVLTGNPVRSAVLDSPLTKAEAKKAMGMDADKKLVLALGGSLGARTINESVANAIATIETAGAQLYWQTGKFYTEECAVIAAPHAPVVKATAFIDDMGTAYRAADLVVARAGAGTISELQLAGLPVVLVPSPNVAEDHQRKNAQALVDKGAAVMVLDADAREQLPSEIGRLLADDATRQKLSENIATMALRDADDKIVDAVCSLLEQKRDKN